MYYRQTTEVNRSRARRSTSVVARVIHPCRIFPKCAMIWALSAGESKIWIDAVNGGERACVRRLLI